MCAPLNPSAAVQSKTGFLASKEYGIKLCKFGINPRLNELFPNSNIWLVGNNYLLRLVLNDFQKSATLESFLWYLGAGYVVEQHIQ